MAHPRSTFAEMSERYSAYFVNYLKRASELELLDTELLKFDLEKLG